ncbi:unnamed protein product [Caenorhabditis auriculariae]|uniref:Uncharacterized protein n=1 Tax=Caenorhabditis auriculariae TaxID=2777116 RepID=A0A8S1HR68_9PELO|nr:unnamed protein product [Caenorhabditis auriculariae]
MSSNKNTNSYKQSTFESNQGETFTDFLLKWLEAQDFSEIQGSSPTCVSSTEMLGNLFDEAPAPTTPVDVVRPVSCPTVIDDGCDYGVVPPRPVRSCPPVFEDAVVQKKKPVSFENQQPSVFFSEWETLSMISPVASSSVEFGEACARMARLFEDVKRKPKAISPPESLLSVFRNYASSEDLSTMQISPLWVNSSDGVPVLPVFVGNPVDSLRLIECRILSKDKEMSPCEWNKASETNITSSSSTPTDDTLDAISDMNYEASSESSSQKSASKTSSSLFVPRRKDKKKLTVTSTSSTFTVKKAKSESSRLNLSISTCTSTTDSGVFSLCECCEERVQHEERLERRLKLQNKVIKLLVKLNSDFMLDY